MVPIVLALLLVTAPPPFEVQTLDGRLQGGVPSELNADRLTLQTSQGPVALDVANLMDLARKQKPLTAKAGGVCVELVDGSVLYGQQYAADAKTAKVVLSESRTVEMSLKNVLTVRLDRDNDALTPEWTRLIGEKRDADLLVIRKEDALDYHKGVLHDVAEEMVQFDVDGEVLPVKRAKIYGFAYHRSAAGESPAAPCRITDVFGSQWSAKKPVLAESLRWTTLGGVEMAMPLDEIVRIDFSAGKIAYLSDMTPDSVHWTPYFGGGKVLPIVEQFYLPCRDGNYAGNPLQLAGVAYRKGLAVRSRTELTFRVPKDFNRFLAVVGIDDGVRPNGKVRLVVEGDGKPLFEAAITGNDPPKPIEADLSGVRRLSILVDFSDVAGVGDYLLLCNARVTK